jgi:hypothetical protein
MSDELAIDVSTFFFFLFFFLTVVIRFPI